LCPLSSSLIFCPPPPPSQLCTLSLHDALPICRFRSVRLSRGRARRCGRAPDRSDPPSTRCSRSRVRRRSFRARGHEWSPATPLRSEEHTSELQSRENLVCRLLLEKKNK